MATTSEQQYASEFGKSFGGFIFSGNPCTGKNHLAAAIGNQIIRNGKSILIATLPDLMIRVRETYQKGAKTIESQLISGLCEVGLLVQDGVGAQCNNLNEELITFQVVDRLSSNKKPVGILTNLNFDELAKTLGDRVIDRLRMGSPTVINFTWESSRRQVK